jgi:MYXO-CTERM domain-containing protein
MLVPSELLIRATAPGGGRLPRLFRSHGVRSSGVIVRLAGLSLALCIGAAQAGTIVFDGFNMTANGSANLAASGNLQLIPDDLGAGTDQDGSAYITTPYGISANTKFTATFSYLMSNSDTNMNGLGLADGLTFILQNSGVNALGTAGGSLGYSPTAPSVAVALRTYTSNVIEIDQGGFLASGPSQSLNLQGAQYDVTDTGTVTVSYDGAGNLSVTGSDSGGDVINLSSTIDLSQLGGSAFIGFTGASASGSADEEITSFTLSVTPEPATALFAIPALLALAALRRRKA